ncbi:MAG: T9SS C-terminal target domain-containing protein [Candidatus Zixiibacteriota bacterium]|nr:MAG: T9SS C-terminal target domain-containing protein [candidate division Zixibacteria bacterium]
MSWPAGNDPFYLANTSENTARRTYYGVNGVPTQVCDGEVQGNWTWTSGAINYRLAVPSPLWLDLTLSAAGDTLDVTVTAVSEQNLSGSYVLHLVLLDKHSVLYNSPNGQPNHYHSMRDMAPSAQGQPFSITAGDTTEFYGAFALNPAWMLDNLDVACFVQSNVTPREIIQAHCESVPLDFPNVTLAEYQVSDPTGNQDGRVDPGETGDMVVTLENQVPFHDATNVQATLSTDEPLIQVTQATAGFPDIPAGNSASNPAQPFQFYVDPQFEAHEVTFTVTVMAEPGAFSAAYDVTFMVGRPDILLVNDDLMGNYLSYYRTPLDSLGRSYDSWTQVEAGLLPAAEMMRYPIVIWYTGSDDVSTLDNQDQQKIQDFLDGGGRLLLSSQNAGDMLGGTAFYQDVLHAQHVANQMISFWLDGVGGDPISSGLTLALAGAGGAGNANSSSSLTPLAPAVGIFTWQNVGSMGALRYDGGNHRLVYFAFALEAVTGLNGTTTRTEVLENCLEWLEGSSAVEPPGGTAALPRELALTRISPNPFNPVAAVEFDLPLQGWVRLEAFDLQGRRVAQIASREMTAGRHHVTWDASALPSGLYLLRLTSGSHSATAKAALLK